MPAHRAFWSSEKVNSIATKLVPLPALTTCIIYGLLLTHVSAKEITVGELKLSDPCIRAMLPGAQVAGGYLTITNSGETDDRLISVRSERSEKAEIHEMTMDDDVMIMRELPTGLAIPAGKSVKLTPGGYHMMLIDVAEPFKEGQLGKLTLKFEKSGSVSLDALVGPAAGSCLQLP